jgi:hypothetical protein
VSRAGHLEANPAADVPLPPGGELVLIGDTAAEERFLRRYPGVGHGRRIAAAHGAQTVE